LLDRIVQLALGERLEKDLDSLRPVADRVGLCIAGDE